MEVVDIEEVEIEEDEEAASLVEDLGEDTKVEVLEVDLQVEVDTEEVELDDLNHLLLEEEENQEEETLTVGRNKKLHFF